MNPPIANTVPASAGTPVADGLISPELPPPPPGSRAAITAGWVRDEAAHVRHLLEQARLPETERLQAQATAADLVRRVRARAKDQGAIEAFMRQYDLGSEEGVLLMCVAEALLRIPDQETADKLIRDKLGDADWKKHMGQSDSRRGLEEAHGPVRFGAGQRIDLGPDAHRPPRRSQRRDQA
jgi:RHH-type transcriptional regulator, proline utilization regulon repressor / proline dehydrogenase / delta 1-pyrroline-5-carboxylate dehydrogenase